MTILKMRLTWALTLSLCIMLIGAPLALAETNTSAESIETTLSTVTPEATEISADPEIASNTEVSEQTEASDELDSTIENDSSNSSDIPENTEVDIPPVLDENEEVVPPGTLPDSPFYWLTILIEKLQVILTFDPLEKTELLEEQGLERIAEAAALIEQGDVAQAEEALKASTEKVVEAQEFLAQLTETDSETRQKLEIALSKTHANNVQTLGGLLDKLPPQAAQRVALNIVRSLEKNIAKMDKKDLHMVAQELKKVTKGIEDSELTEEDEAVLENLDQTLEEGESVEDIAPSDATQNSVALATNTLADNTAEISEISEISSQSVVQNAKNKATEPKLAAKVVEPTMPQEQKQKTQDDGKVQEQKQQEDKIKTEQENTIQEENPNLNNPAQKQEGKDTQLKVQKEREKGAQSGGKAR